MSAREALERIAAVVRSDAWAATFQTLGQYRSSLLRHIGGEIAKAGGRTPEPLTLGEELVRHHMPPVAPPNSGRWERAVSEFRLAANRGRNERLDDSDVWRGIRAAMTALAASAPVAPPEPVCPVTGVWEATCSCGRHAPPAGGTREAGWLVWDEKYGNAYRGRIYDTEEQAKKVLDGIVWHSRERYAIRRAALAGAAGTREADDDRPPADMPDSVHGRWLDILGRYVAAEADEYSTIQAIRDLWAALAASAPVAPPEAVLPECVHCGEYALPVCPPCREKVRRACDEASALVDKAFGAAPPACASETSAAGGTREAETAAVNGSRPVNRLTLTEEEDEAYRWASQQQFQSVSARFARILAGVVRRALAERGAGTDTQPSQGAGQMTKGYFTFIRGTNASDTSAHYSLAGAIAHLLLFVNQGDEWSLAYDHEYIASGKHQPPTTPEAHIGVGTAEREP